MPGKSETDLEHQGRVYPSVENQMRQDPVEEDTDFPGGKRGWLWSRKNVPTFISGLLHPTTKKVYKTWVFGLHYFFKPFTTYAGSTIDALMGNIFDFFNKCNLMDANILADIVTVTDTTSVASKEWTVTATKKWIIIFCSMTNDTDTFQPELTITPSGGSATICGSLSGTNIPATATINLIGYGSRGPSTGIPLVLDAGDKIKIEDITFTASDVMRAVIGYIEVAA